MHNFNTEVTISENFIGIDRKVEYLRRPDSYPSFTGEVGVEETHMSWVFLTDEYAYKMKKPVRFPFLDFSTLDLREQDCHEEVRLNRRLASDVYIGVVALNLDPGGRLQLEGEGEPVEWLVKMHRLPLERMLDQAIKHNTVTEADIRRFTTVLSSFYQHAPPVSMTQQAYRQRFAHDVNATLKELSDPAYRISKAQLESISESMNSFLQSQPALFGLRVEEQRIVEGHGDLRPEHVCLNNRPVFIDCLEFNHSFRILDPVEELAFLTMECERAGAGYISEIVFDTYATITADQPAASLVYFYKASRALLRAKLSVWHIKDHDRNQHKKWLGKADEYLKLAERYADKL